EIVDGADVWMIERRCQSRFTIETFQVGVLGGEFRGQNFDDDVAAQPGVGRFVDRALSPGADLCPHFVIPQSLPSHGPRYLTLKQSVTQLIHIVAAWM